MATVSGLLPLFLILKFLTSILGDGNPIVELYKEKVLFTPYNITGMIMLVLNLFGIWVGRKTGIKLHSAVKKIVWLISTLPYLATPLSWLKLEFQNDPIIDEIIARLRTIGRLFLIILFLTAMLGLLCVVRTWKKKREKIARKTGVDLSPNIEGVQDPSLPKEPIAPIVASVAEGWTSVSNTTAERIPLSSSILEGEKYLIAIANGVCPHCGGRLRSLRNRQTDKWFKGCENYFAEKKCGFTLDYWAFKNIQRKYST